MQLRALLAVATAAVGASTYPSAWVALSSHRAGADHVRLQLRLTYEMQCGWPGPGPLIVVFPAVERLPTRFSHVSVLLDGKPVAAVTRTGRQVTIGIPPPVGVQCDVIAPGTADVVFTSAAGIGNPPKPGAYALSARRGGTVYRTTFRIVP